ncbi:glycosyl transferase [Gemmatimonadetes bacterium T265]|nr:glycosyl transferase [Gemmatimonadetes bacterium T265]
MRILVSRTDRLGDVALTLPLCGLLQARLGATTVFLGRGYTRPLLDASGAVDEVLDWDAVAGNTFARRRDFLRAARADAVLHVFPRAAIAWGTLAARVPRRVGTTHRWYHWPTCNVLEPLERRASPLHEAQLDVRLARSLLPDADLTLTPAELAPFARLAPRVPVAPALAPLLAPDRFVLVVHPRSSGSAGEWPPDRWRALVTALDPARFRVLVTGSAAEGAAMRGWLEVLPPHAHDLTGRLALAELIAVLGAADGVVAASTGPLHIAALLGRHVLGLYAAVRPVHAGRWGPIGPHAEVIEAGTVEEIAVARVLDRVGRWVG